MEEDPDYDYQDDSDPEEEATVGIICIKAMPENREVVVAGDGSGNITMFDTRSKQSSVLGLFTRTATSRLADLKGRAHGAGGVTSLEVLGSGQQIFSGGCDGSVCVWDVRTGARLAKEHGHKAAVTECGSLGGNNVLTTSLDGTMKVWNVSTMKAHNFGQIQPKGVQCAARVATSQPDERIIVSGSRDDAPVNMACISAHGGGLEDRMFGHMYGHEGPVASLAACGDKRIISGGGFGCHKVLLWEMDLLYPGEPGACDYAMTSNPTEARWGPKHCVELGAHNGAVNACCSVTTDGACTVGSDGSVRIWRLKSRSLACILQSEPASGSSISPGRSLSAASEGLLSVRATADESCIVSGSSGGALKVWDVTSEHVKSESFLRTAGGEVFRRQLTAVRRSLPGLDGSGKGGRERKGRRATLNQLPGDDEPFSARSEPLSGYSGTPRSQQHQVGFGGATTAPTKTRASPQRPRRSLGSVPWQTTMGTVDIISRPPNPEPAELHRGPKYNRLQAAPSTSTTKQLAAAAILSNN